MKTKGCIAPHLDMVHSAGRCSLMRLEQFPFDLQLPLSCQFTLGAWHPPFSAHEPLLPHSLHPTFLYNRTLCSDFFMLWLHLKQSFRQRVEGFKNAWWNHCNNCKGTYISASYNGMNCSTMFTWITCSTALTEGLNKHVILIITNLYTR